MDDKEKIWEYVDTRLPVNFQQLNALSVIFDEMRAETTKQRAMRILQILNAPDIEWIRDRDLKRQVFEEQPAHERQFYRTINILLKHKLIEKRIDETSRTPGARPVYYRVPKHYNPRIFSSREELVEDLNRCNNEIMTAEIKLIIAKKWLSVLGVSDPGEKIDAEFNRLFPGGFKFGPVGTINPPPEEP